MNTDQGSQFTSFAWTDRLKRVGTRIAMDGKGRCSDNIFIERLWRSLKHEAGAGSSLKPAGNLSKNRETAQLNDLTARLNVAIAAGLFWQCA